MGGCLDLTVGVIIVSSAAWILFSRFNIQNILSCLSSSPSSPSSPLPECSVGKHVLAKER